MVIFNGNAHLDYIYQKSLRYQHHWENYPPSLLEGLIPSNFKITKHPAFELFTDEFVGQWSSILYYAERCLVKLLLTESQNVIAKVQSEVELEILVSETTYDITLESLEQKHTKFKQNVEKRCDKKTCLEVTRRYRL